MAEEAGLRHEDSHARVEGNQTQVPRAFHWLFGHSASSPKAATSALRLKAAFRLFGWGFLFGSLAAVAVGYFGYSAVVVR
jgi:type VI protein secretion system component VasF